MKRAHKHMNINEIEMMTVMDDIMNSVKEYGVSDETYKDVLGIIYSLKDDVMYQ